MRALALLLAFLQLPVLAFATDYAVMLNLNYSTKEWETFRAASERCGRTPVCIPPVKLLPVGEALFTMRDALGEQLKKARPNWKKNQIDDALEEIMRMGGEWKGDPEVARAFAAEIDNLYQQSRIVNEMEAKYGSVASQFERTAAAIRKASGSIGSMAISGHADGWNFTGESATRLSWGDLDEVLKRNPRTFLDTRHVLLLGCYNMTANNRGHWNTLFPYASMIAGFGVKAPSRTDVRSRNFISETLDTACQLDDKIAADERYLDPAYLKSQFKKLPSVANTQSVIDYCRQVIEGIPGSSNALSCDEQWTTMLAQTEAVQNMYLDLRTLKKDPPKFDSASSEVRMFYSALHGICPAKQASQFDKEEAEYYEGYRRSVIENTIRLIFWWKVQKNFNTYYANDLAELEQSLEGAGVKARIPALDGTTGRVEFVQSYNAIKDEIETRKMALRKALLQRGNPGAEKQLRALEDAEKRSAVLRPLFFLQGEHTVGINMSTDTEGTLAREAIPFNWIEGTVLRPRSP